MHSIPYMYIGVKPYIVLKPYAYLFKLIHASNISGSFSVLIGNCLSMIWYVWMFSSLPFYYVAIYQYIVIIMAKNICS